MTLGLGQGLFAATPPIFPREAVSQLPRETEARKGFQAASPKAQCSQRQLGKHRTSPSDTWMRKMLLLVLGLCVLGHQVALWLLMCLYGFFPGIYWIKNHSLRTLEIWAHILA